MKSNKLLWVLVPVAVALVAVICVVTALYVSDTKMSNKYYDNIRSARKYAAEGNLDQVLLSYKAAIQLDPENPEAYLELAQVYMDNEMYMEANNYARLGFNATGDKRFELLLPKIELKLTADSEAAPGESIVSEMESEPQTATTANIFLKKDVLNIMSDYCFGELTDIYGAPTSSFVSDTEGYRMKFPGLNCYVYFKNTSAYPDIIDTASRIPRPDARPYKYLVPSPSFIILGFEGFISHNQLIELLGTNVENVFDEERSIYMACADWNGCRISIETDAEGNVISDRSMIEIYTAGDIKTAWVDEPEIEESETEEEIGTFTLGSQTFSYDVEIIQIMGEYIPDLSPLAHCSRLQYLELYDCEVGSLDPLASCGSLMALVLRGSTGFSDVSPLAGLTNLIHLDLHSSSDVMTIAPLMNNEYEVLHVCNTGVSYDEAVAYKQLHPACEVWYDNSVLEY